MARPRAITDGEILAAARAAFLKSGTAATVLNVAARCGVGEATVFRRFATKRKLFAAALAEGGEPDWLRALPERLGRSDVRANLIELGMQVIEFGRNFAPLMAMKMLNPDLCSFDRRRSLFISVTRGLTEFFAVQIRERRLRRIRDARFAAGVFMGAIHHFVLSGVLSADERRMSPKTFMRRLVDIFGAGRD